MIQREIAIDCDGTIVKHEYPKMGEFVPGAVETIALLKAQGHKLYLWTVRSGKELDEAVVFLKERGMVFDGINENPTQKGWSQSPKCYAHIFIDDAAACAPLIKPSKTERPYLDWPKMKIWLEQNDYLPKPEPRPRNESISFHP